jgi:hypothetical protein
MPIGKSGRIVIEVDPILKQNLYSALVHRQMTLREWFILKADDYLAKSQEDQQEIEFPRTSESHQ